MAKRNNELDDYVTSTVIQRKHLVQAKELIQSQIRQRQAKPIYPKTLIVKFRNRSDCNRFASLIKLNITSSDRVIEFSSPKTKGNSSFQFSGDPNPRKGGGRDSDFYKTHWVGMPAFHQESRDFVYFSLKMVFKTAADYAEFAHLVRIHLSESQPAIYYPKWTPSKIKAKRWKSTLPIEQITPRYPVYIVSKGRSHSRLTSKTLEELKVPYYIVVEPNDYDAYAQVIDPKKILTLDYNTDASNTKGPGPARNFCRNHSLLNKHRRHWVLDDNIDGFFRLHENRRYRVADSAIFRAAEDFVDRYENIWVAGFEYRFFRTDKARSDPFKVNGRIYSCLLISNHFAFHFPDNPDNKFVWRERYNEDTILTLDVLKNNACTLLFNAFLQGKIATQTKKGGNTEVFYDPDGNQVSEGVDSDLRNSGKYNPFSTSPKTLALKRAYPDVVREVLRYGRHHHDVDYAKYGTAELKFKRSFKPKAGNDDYGMCLIRTP